MPHRKSWKKLGLNPAKVLDINKKAAMKVWGSEDKTVWDENELFLDEELEEKFEDIVNDRYYSFQNAIGSWRMHEWMDCFQNYGKQDKKNGDWVMDEKKIAAHLKTTCDDRFCWVCIHLSGKKNTDSTLCVDGCPCLEDVPKKPKEEEKPKKVDAAEEWQFPPDYKPPFEFKEYYKCIEGRIIESALARAEREAAGLELPPHVELGPSP